MKKILVVILFLISNPAFAESSNNFEDKITGLKLSKPSSWQFVTIELHYENLKRIEIGDKEFHEHIIKHSSVPLVAIMKYP